MVASIELTRSCGTADQGRSMHIFDLPDLRPYAAVQCTVPPCAMELYDLGSRQPYFASLASQHAVRCRLEHMLHHPRWRSEPACLRAFVNATSCPSRSSKSPRQQGPGWGGYGRLLLGWQTPLIDLPAFRVDGNLLTRHALGTKLTGGVAMLRAAPGSRARDLRQRAAFLVKGSVRRPCL